ncbi:MAG: PQQ-binding-like beta-propeller repeat protein [Candidatus Nealsonbacteria bacterium]|nr:PQQ-binding-like beta-propeller repeat protein [Candidatus Nealsonbacteria bacterium]
MKSTLVVICLVPVLSMIAANVSPAADRLQWGEALSRNMVSHEKGLPDGFDPGQRDAAGNIDVATTENVRWTARLGNTTYGSPTVAGGRVFIGTNNEMPRDPRCQGDRGVLMCFDEKTGEFLWQLVVPKFYKIKWADWRLCGVSSTPTVEGERLYLMSNRCEVMCLDVQGMANGNDGPFTDEGRHTAPADEPALKPGPKDADIVWIYDLNEELGVAPHNAANCSVLLHGDLLYVCTCNGVDWTHKFVINPKAPSVIVLNKQTGKLVARDDFGIGPDITHGQWTSPSMGEVDGKMLAFHGSGDNWLYAYEALDPKQLGDGPVKLKNVFKFNGHPAAQTQDYPAPDHQHDSTSYEVTAMPVFHNGRVYVPFTQEPFHRMKEGWLACIDASKTGDVTRSALVWKYDALGSSASTPAIADGLVYAVDFLQGKLHCIDAETGKCYWIHDVGRNTCGSPLVADGKVYLGTGMQLFWVLAAGKELKVLNRIRMLNSINSTPTAANGVLYVATDRHLYAVGK